MYFDVYSETYIRKLISVIQPQSCLNLFQSLNVLLQSVLSANDSLNFPVPEDCEKGQKQWASVLIVSP